MANFQGAKRQQFLYDWVKVKEKFKNAPRLMEKGQNHLQAESVA